MSNLSPGISYGRFAGDGRTKICALPGEAPEGSQPMEVTRSRARLCIDAFMAARRSTHSPLGAMLWILVEYCREQGIGIEIRCAKEEGRIIGWETRMEDE